MIASNLCLTLADRDLKIGNGELDHDVAICLFDLTVLPSGAGKGEQILNQSLHPLGAVHRVVDVFVGLFVEFSLVAFGQELGVGRNHAQRLLQVVRIDVGKLLQSRTGAVGLRLLQIVRSDVVELLQSAIGAS